MGGKLNRVRLLMLLEAVTFAVASLIHAGVLVSGYEHVEARIAEAVIAAVLLAGLAATFVRASWARSAAVAAQAFALIATLVGIFTIVVGVGPRTVPDVVYHILIVIVLAWGIVLARRLTADSASDA